MSHSTSLVVWGQNLTSHVGEKYTREELALVKLSPYQYSVIIGLLLSDGWLSKVRKNACLGFGQSGSNIGYFWFVFWSLSHYCSSYPLLRFRTRLGNKNINWQFSTRSMPCITELYSLFYLNKVKVIPQDIYNMLTPVALAHLIMGDGSMQRHGLTICTDLYDIKDIVRLINVLIIKYRLDCILRKHGQYNRIYIKEISMPLLRQIVSPYMCSSMLYKIKL